MAEFQSRRFGKYLLLEKLATGGMAQLYRAKIIGVQGFEKFIAIKMILPHIAEEKDLIASFIDEAKLAALLNHQNIVQIYDFGEMENNFFITMEYLFGKDLRLIMAKARALSLPLQIEHALYITSRICAGLEYAHTLKDFQGRPLNIIHRDISPQNVIVTYEGDVKIVDFGIAKAATQSTATQVGMIKGKVAYMSPEQASGRPIDRRSDIFSCGVLLYELATGNKLFKGEDTLQILARVRDAEFDAQEMIRTELPPKLFAILNTALAKDPDARYQSCAEMQADIEECLYDLGMRPSARSLAQYMKSLFAEEIAAEEALMRESATAAAHAEPAAPEPALPAGAAPRHERPPSDVVPPPASPPAAAPRKKTGVLAAAIAAVALAGAGAAFILKGKPAAPPPAAPARPAPAQPAPARPGPQEPVTPRAAQGGATAPAQDAASRARALVAEATPLVDKDPAKARGILLEATRIDPGNIQGHFQLGHVYMKMKEHAKAAEAYGRAVAIDPGFAEGFFNLGYVYASRKDYEKAEEMYLKAVSLSPPYLDEALFNLAMVQDRRGKRAEATENLRKAVEVNPKNELAKKFLAKFRKGGRG